jgi:molybdopterin-guanine dinucleotide biosynthesis protein A
MNAIVLAGGPPDALACVAPGAPNKAFVPIVGQTLVARTIAALRATPQIEHIVVVAPEQALGNPALHEADERRPDGPRMIESLQSGVAGFPTDEPVIVTAADLPILTPGATGRFIAAAAARDLDLAYAIVERAVHRARYPNVPHTWAHLRDGTFCGGGMVMLRPRIVARLLPVLDAFGAARKSPLRLASLLGWDVLLRLALRQLSVADAQARASRILGAPVGAIVCPDPEIAVNVDRPSDIPLACALVSASSTMER